MRGLFITGTDTGVGKTFVACAIAQVLRSQGRRVGAYKPVCSGSRCDAQGGEVWDDVESLLSAVGGGFSTAMICPQCFSAPLAAPVAARMQGEAVDAARLRQGVDAWRGVAEILLVEGAGGWLSPITDEETVADLAHDLGFPVLIVAPNRLGAINHTLLTVEAVRNRGVSIAGVVLNRIDEFTDSSTAFNAEEISRRSQTPVLADLQRQPQTGLCRPLEIARIDWFEVAADAVARPGERVTSVPR